MGIDFRNGEYVRRVKFGKRTVKAGEAAAIWDSQGRHRQVIGPMVVHLWFSTIRFLDRHAATPTQYLAVLHRSGKRETIRGPAVLYENPVLHQSIEVKESIQLTAPTEALVVYTEVSVGTPVGSSATFDATPVGAKLGLGAEEKQEDEEAEAAEGYSPIHEKSVSRRIIRGPAIFVPKVDEWTHEFVWSGNQARSRSAIVPGALHFNVLETNTQTWSTDAKMRTSDNIPFTVQLTLTYKIKSIESMLASSTDPVAEWWSGLEADMCVLGDNVASSTVLAKGLNAVMSTLDSFPRLCARMESNGFSLEGVILRRVLASEALEKRFKEAAAEETDGARRLAIAETNLKAERIAALSKAEKEVCEAEAQEKREARAAEAKEASLRLEMERAESRRQKEHEMEATQLAHELEIKRQKEEAEAASANAQIERQVRYLKELKALDVDLTSYLMNGGGEDRGSSPSPHELTKLVPQTFTFSLADTPGNFGTAVPPPPSVTVGRR